MKIHLTIFLFFIALKSLSAQENKPQPPTENLQLEEIIDDEDEVHIIVQNNAEYPGGLLNFRKEFKIYFETPEIEENRIKVPVVFIIEKDGTISDIKVYNDPGYDIQERVIKAFEKIRIDIVCFIV